MSLDTHKILMALHEARKHPSTPPEDMEALISAAHAIHFIELSGHGYNFEDYLTGITDTTTPALRAFATGEEAHIWLKEDPLPPRAVTLLIGGARYCVIHSLDSGHPTPLRLPTAEELAGMYELAREHLRAFPEHVEALTAAGAALHYIQENGLSDSFVEFLANASSASIRSFATREEAEAWLKQHPRPPHGGWVRIGQDRYTVGYWRESGRRVLLPVPSP